MSGKVALQDYFIFTDYLKTLDIKIIESAILNTIPQWHESRSWFAHELACPRLFGPDITKIENAEVNRDLRLHDMTKFNRFWLPIISHTNQGFLNFQSFFVGHDVFSVLIDGDAKFIDQAIRIKWPAEHHCLDLDAFEKWQSDCKSLVFNHTIHCWNPLNHTRLKEIEILAHKLAIDYTNSMAGQYISKYQTFHYQ